jgi:hypothetical protein
MTSQNRYLSTGSVGETVTDLSQRRLGHHGGLRRIFRLDVAELARRDYCFSGPPRW